MEQQQQQDNFEQKFCEARTTNESIDKKRARLLYQSRKRGKAKSQIAPHCSHLFFLLTGILENDLLLASFAKKYLDTMEPSQLEEYDRLINTTSNEWDIYYWAVGTKQPPVEYRGPIMDKLIQHARNEEREQRFKQPELN